MSSPSLLELGFPLLSTVIPSHSNLVATTLGRHKVGSLRTEACEMVSYLHGLYPTQQTVHEGKTGSLASCWENTSHYPDHMYLRPELGSWRSLLAEGKRKEKRKLNTGIDIQKQEA